jgi:hypothetical protein
MNSLQAVDPKKEFIEKYGITLEMPATYTFTALIYRPDPRYIVTVNRQVFPENVQFYDYDKLGDKDEDPLDNDYRKEEMKYCKGLSLKAYELKDGKY